VWECYSAPESSILLSDNGQAPLVQFTPTSTGHYYFRLTVRDQYDGGSFNRSAVSYVRVSVVDDPNDPYLLDPNAGRTLQAESGATVTLNGSLSMAPAGTTYLWEHVNPIDESDLTALASVFGLSGCTGQCYDANFDGDADVDGEDLASLAANWGAVSIEGSDQAVARFHAGIARPHIFRLTLTNGTETASETAIVAVNHPGVAEVLTPPPADQACLTP
jgi:hypothetical protein